MKKLICLLFAVIIAIGAAGCSGNSAENKTSKSNGQGVADILSSAAETQPTTVGSVTVPATTAAAANIKYPELDYEAEVDLTALNSNMVYSEVAAMVSTPEKYIGKTVKMQGTFDVYTDINTGTYYYACIIRDATACCSSGIEFSWKGEHKFPDDYPSVGTPVTVGGVFETYPEGDKNYCRLKEADVVFGT
ncbi:MAG: hypothetical protein U0L27_03315 [Ruminococcus sp.]|nr:hypothetical protein [Ruminococcus sp.]